MEALHDPPKGDDGYDRRLTNSLLADLIRAVERAADALERIGSNGSGSLSVASNANAGTSPKGTCMKTDDGRFLWTVPDGVEAKPCKECGEPVRWVKTPKGKWCPVGADNFGHIDVCKGAPRSEVGFSSSEVPF